MGGSVFLFCIRRVVRCYLLSLCILLIPTFFLSFFSIHSALVGQTGIHQQQQQPKKKPPCLVNKQDDPTSGEKAEERWNPTQSVESILLSIVSLLNDPNCSSPANVDAGVRNLLFFRVFFLNFSLI
jgi:hypothetical protein